MGPICLLFAGQSIQQPGMGKPFFGDVTSRQYLNRIAEVSGIELFRFMESAGEAELMPSRIAQRVIHCHHLLAYELLTRTHPQCVVAGVVGHSVGILAALVVAGVISDVDSVRLVAVRGDAFTAACQGSAAGSGLIAVTSDDIESLTERLEADYGVRLALRNTISRAVYGGKLSDLEMVARDARRLDCKAMVLRVEGAFHTPLMKDAKASFGEALDGMVFESPKVPLFMGTSGQKEDDPQRIKDLLVRQIDHPELHLDAMEQSYVHGCRAYAEVAVKCEPVHWLNDQLLDESGELMNDVRTFSAEPEHVASLFTA